MKYKVRAFTQELDLIAFDIEGPEIKHNEHVVEIYDLAKEGVGKKLDKMNRVIISAQNITVFEQNPYFLKIWNKLERPEK